MTVQPSTVADLVTGSTGPVKGDLTGLLKGWTSDRTDAATPSDTAFPATPCSGFSTLDVLAGIPAGGALAIETSADGVSWRRIGSPLTASGPGLLQRAQYLLDGAAFVRGRLTTSGRNVRLSLAGVFS